MATINGTSANNTLKGTSSADTIHGYGGNDLIYGYGGNDLLYGDSGTDTIHGGDGADKIDGGSGSDYMFGDAGNDIFYPSTFAEHIDGGSGTDTISFQKYTSGVTLVGDTGDFNSWNAAGGSVTGVEKILGSQYADHLTLGGDPFNTVIDGAGGNDVIIADGSGTGIVKAYGGGGNDILNYENFHGFGNIHTVGYGGSGNDTLYTHDQTGGTGADTFVLQEPISEQQIGAVIHDFHHSEGDHIQIDIDAPQTPTPFENTGGDIWTAHTLDGDFSFQIVGVTSLTESDWSFT
jgi:Ca2+-binding RTX toxin-like protein